MFAVIFTANPGDQNQQYSDMVQKMRERAFSQYGCLDFVSATAGEQEIAISYWPDMQSIVRWKTDMEHAEAQALGREKWYSGYKVEVLELKRSYKFGDF